MLSGLHYTSDLPLTIVHFISFGIKTFLFIPLLTNIYAHVSSYDVVRSHSYHPWTLVWGYYDGVKGIGTDKLI